MKITFDNSKRQQTLEHRGLDFTHCVEVFTNPHIDLEDNRSDYSEPRFISFGFLKGREVVVVWTPRGDSRRIISMRKANEREQKKFYQHLG